jgi:hypothetical protein
MVSFSPSSLSSGWRSLLFLLFCCPWRMGAGCSGFGVGALSNKLEDPPNQGVAGLEFGIAVLPLDLVVAVAVGGERWLDLELHGMFMV